MSDNNNKELNYNKIEEKKANNEIEINTKEILNFAEKGNILMVKKCLKLDKNCVNIRDSDLYTPLHRAVYNNNYEIVELLIRSGADVRSRTCDGWEPIHCAAKWGHIMIIQLLLNCGADINAVSNGGNTALHLASTHSHDNKLLEFLLFNEDIDITLKNDSGDTALDIAKRSSSLYHLWDYL